MLTDTARNVTADFYFTEKDEASLHDVFDSRRFSKFKNRRKRQLFVLQAYNDKLGKYRFTLTQPYLEVSLGFSIHWNMSFFD